MILCDLLGLKALEGNADGLKAEAPVLQMHAGPGLTLWEEQNSCGLSVF